MGVIKTQTTVHYAFTQKPRRPRVAPLHRQKQRELQDPQQGRLPGLERSACLWLSAWLRLPLEVVIVNEIKED